MSKDGWEREREALRKLARLLTEETRGGLMGEALEHLLEATSLSAGAAFSVHPELDLVAERGLNVDPSDGSRGPEPLRQLLSDLGSRAAASRKLLHVPDVTRSTALTPPQQQEIARRGWRSIAVMPVKHLREVLGVIVLLAKDPALLDPGALAVFETLTHLVALAIERDRRIERERSYRGELAEAGHMASLGLLTATVAHELRGPAGALLVQIDEQQRMLEQLRDAGTDQNDPLVGELAELLTEMKAASGEINTVVSQLLALSRRDSAPERLDLTVIAQEGLSLTRSELKRQGVELVEDYTPGCLTTGRRDNLVQVVLNLIFNAVEGCAASGRSGPKITVRTRGDGARVVLCVDDSGPGVADGDIKVMFQPFFTKQRGRGSGLGLKICSDVVAAHHGHIEVVNLDQGGASFRVLLPRAASPEEAPEKKGAPSSTHRLEKVENRRVFVVDDDELFTRTMRRTLRPHDVRASATASEAEIALLDPKYSPDLVLCDLGLPGFGGDVLHARIKAKRPQIAERFVFVTGGACTKQEADYLRSSGCPTLLKPVEIDDIWGALSQSQPQISVAPEGVATLRSEPPTSRSESPTLPPTPKRP